MTHRSIRFGWVGVVTLALVAGATEVSAQTCAGGPAVGQGWALQLDGTSSVHTGPITAPSGEVGAVVSRGPAIGSVSIGRVSYRSLGYAGNYAAGAIAIQSPRTMSPLSICARLAHQREISTDEIFDDFSLDYLSVVTSLGVSAGVPVRIGGVRIVPFLSATRGRVESLTGFEGQFRSDGVTTAWALETGLGVPVVSRLQLIPSVTIRSVPEPAEPFTTFRLTMRFCPGRAGCQR